MKSNGAWLVTGLLLAINAQANDDTKITDAFKGVMQDRNFSNAREEVFVEKCGMCHRQMGMGTVVLARRVAPAVAMLEQRTDLTPPLIQHAVRKGLGNMPRINRAEVSEEQLNAIVSWLTEPSSR